MAVQTYDSSVAFRQDQVARLGERAGQRTVMTTEERQKFQNSPFMQKMKEIDQTCWGKFSERDRERAKRDKSFRPSDADFEAPKAHTYDKGVNYYKVLGVDDIASNEEIKKSYRKLSLTYHPDKQSNKTQEEKEEAALVFMEIKNAYKTLSDDPTRRQYDYDRERESVSAEVHGKKPHEKPSFDAIQALLKLAERQKELQKPPGDDVQVQVLCRLEKFVFGGHKAIKRMRVVKDRELGGFKDQERVFRIDVPPGAEQGWPCEFRRQGDHHEDREPDSLIFQFRAKPHSMVERNDNDLQVKGTIELPDCHRAEPYFSSQAASVGGRHVVFWGRNPFFRQEGPDFGEMTIRVLGEGVSKEGALCVSFRLGLRNVPAGRGGVVPDPNAQVGPSSASGARPFIEQFGLGPQWGFTGESSASGEAPRKVHGQGGAMDFPAMQNRLERRKRDKLRCTLELSRWGQPTELSTRPHSSIAYYANVIDPANPMFAIVLTSPPCAKKKAEREWDLLKSKLVPILQKTGFHLFSEARKILPRRIARKPAFFDYAQLEKAKQLDAPWKQLGDEAFARGSHWQAMNYYTKRLEELGIKVSDDVEEIVAGDDEGEATEGGEIAANPSWDTSEVAPEPAKVLSNRALCFAKLQDHNRSLADAKKATEIAPRWAKAWLRVGMAADKVQPSESMDAYVKAVELEPSKQNVAQLQAAALRSEVRDIETAHGEKESGNEAMRVNEFGAAVARYTLCISRVPLKPVAKEGQEPPEDEHALLRGILYANRSAAFTKLRDFESAVADGREAVGFQPQLATAHVQLGVALLGIGNHHEAYGEFARAMSLEAEHKTARKGRAACLKELVMWKSAQTGVRFNNRFWFDIKRPKGSTRVFSLSDIFFDDKINEDWCHNLSDHAFQEDVLIVAGNLGGTKNALARGLTTLKQKFRRVFFMPGNHDLQIHIHEHGKFPDSLAKMYALFNVCDELEVDIFPAPVAEGLLIFPLFSWYAADFDADDPFPDPNAKFNKYCKWPIDADSQVWKFMMKLNEPFLNQVRLPGATVITFSHFLPRRNLPFDQTKKNLVKAVGCEMIDEQARAIGSKMHIYGQSVLKYSATQNGVRYVNQPLGYESAKDAEEKKARRLMMVHDGKALCMQEWGSDGEPPLGFVKRIVQVSFLQVTGAKDMDIRKIRTAVQNMSAFAGIRVTFDHLGSRQKEKADFAKEVWPDLTSLCFEATHGLLIVADNPDSLRFLNSSEVYKKEWANATASVVKNSITFNMPLGVDLVHEKKADATLFVFGFRCAHSVTPDSDEYAALDKAAVAINKLPGIEGKIAVGLSSSGWGKFSQKELMDQIGLISDHSAGVTHCFTVWVDAPSSFKMLSASKTFAKFKTAYEACLSKQRGGPTVMGFCLPLEITATASAPKPEKPKVNAKAAAKAGMRR